MIGNDIVDLSQARQDSNWQRRGFLDKVFTEHEQQLIRSASDPEIMIWALWSMKESAYKAVIRETGQRFFAPQKLVCSLKKSCAGVLKGHVSYQKTYSTTSMVTTRYVASVASLADMTQSVNPVVVTLPCTDYQHQHRIIYDQLIRYYSTYFSVPESQIRVQKNKAGVPTLVVHDSSQKPINRPISLSHHGHYGAFVLL